MEFLSEYGMFLARTATVAAAVAAVAAFVLAGARRGGRRPGKGTIRITRLNERIDGMRDALRRAALDKERLKRLARAERREARAGRRKARAGRRKAGAGKAEDAADAGDGKRVFVLNFKGDLAAGAVACLREEITTVLSMARTTDEVLLRLESPGGMVHAYGLAASQLLRLRDRGIPLTVCVDKVAASGGYMMACLADRLVAAPFAIIGSIGVLLQTPNFHRALKRRDVDYEIVAAGEYKRTLTAFGEITQKGRDKAQEDVDAVHGVFKDWVKRHRPDVDIDAIATGETWVGAQAKERLLVDEIGTSDERVVEACGAADVFEVEYEPRRSLQDRLGAALETALDRALDRWLGRSSGGYR